MLSDQLSMADLFAAAFRLILEFLLEVALYATGRLLIPVVSFGRIRIAPLRQPIGRARELPTRSSGDIVTGEGWCKFAGFLFWAVAILLLVHIVGSRA